MGQRMIDLPSATLAVHEWGPPDGPTVLHLHHLGISGTGRHVAEVAAALAERYGARVVAPDFPGFGRSSTPTRPEQMTPPALALLVRDLLDALSIDRAAAVQGLSWGATVACHFAAKYADRLGALVLLDAGHGDAQDDPALEAHLPADERLARVRQDAAEFRFADLDAALSMAQSGAARWTTALEVAWRSNLRVADGQVCLTVEPEVYAAALQGFVDHPPSTTWPAIAAANLPVLLLLASEPPERREFQRQCSQRLAEVVPRAEIRWVDTRHDVVNGLGPALADLVADWLPLAPRRR
jgi:pimeloyl-ACP methyl ester carboxylesterase